MLVARVGAQAGFATVLAARVGAQAGFAGTVLAARLGLGLGFVLTFRVEKQNIGSPRNRNPVGAVYSNWSQQLYDDLVFLARKTMN